MRRSTFPIVLAALLLAGLVARAEAGMDEAFSAFQQGDFQTAFAEAQGPANEGDAEAQFLLGFLYHEGRGVEQDSAKAVLWYEKSAEQGYALAQANLGSIYANGLGVPQDFERAAKWMRMAAEQGDALAQYNLATQYDFGRGVRQDYREAAKWYQRAAEQGHPEAQTNLSYLYSNGLGVDQDYIAAAKWLRAAAENDHAFAQYDLGISYANGEGVPQDIVRAYMWNELAAVQGVEQAIQNRELLAKRMTVEQLEEAERLAREWAPGTSTFLWDKGLAAFEAKDYPTALEAWLPLAHQGDPEIQNNVGTIYIALGNFEEALKWHRRAAEHGIANAQHSVGLAYLHGEGGLPQDNEEAASWFRRAAEQGHGPAQYNLGVMYFQDTGLQQDYVEAYLWFGLAASQYQARIDEGWDMRKFEKDAERMRSTVGNKLSPAQREEAQQRLDQWVPKSN